MKVPVIPLALSLAVLLVAFCDSAVPKEGSEISVLREDLKAQLNRFRELEKSHAELERQVKLLGETLKEMGHKPPPGKKVEKGDMTPVQPGAISVPIGFVYTQLPGQAEPSELWPDYNWESITSEYAGLFFRAEGGDSSSFGETQNDRTSRITQFATDYYYCDYDNFRFPSEISIPESGWSEIGRAGWYVKGQSDDMYNCEGMQVKSSGGETRPRNTAI